MSAGYQKTNDRLSIYQRLLAAGYDPTEANDICLKINRRVYRICGSRLLDPGDRTILELPKGTAE